MNEQDLQKYIDDRIQEHPHKGSDSQRVSFNHLRDIPDLVYNPLTKDLALGGYKITGGTLISGQTEVTSLEATDEFLISDASDSGNLKRIDRQYFGEYSTAGSGTSVYSSASGLSTLSFTVLFSGTITFSVTTPTGASNSLFNLYYYLPGADVSTDGAQTKDTSGSNVSWPLTPGVTGTTSWTVFVYAGTRLKAVISGKTMQVGVGYDKTLRTIPYGN